MKVYSGSEIRNVVLVGHNDTGKTMLVSQLLFNAGATTRLGRIEDGTTTTDFDPDEIERKHSISSAVAFVEWKDTKVNLLDTPGFGIFQMEAKTAIRVADAAALVVSGVTGVEVNTEKMWKFADEFGLPRLIIVNKMDRERASSARALESLQKKFGKNVVPIQLPIGEEKDFSGVIDLVAMKAYSYANDASGKFETVDIPEKMKASATEWREKLIEKVAEGDDTLMEKFFEQGGLSQEELMEGLQREVAHQPDLPRPLRLGLAQHRRTAHPRQFRGAVSSGGHEQDRGGPRPEGTARHVRPPRRSVPGGAGLQDLLRSLLRTRVAVPRLLGHVQVRHYVLEHHARSRRARRQAPGSAGQAAGAGQPSSRPATSAPWRS